MYQYKATLRKVVDGDTVDLDVDLGFYMTSSLRFRILGVDTPELRGGTDESKAKAKLAKAFVEAELGNAVGTQIIIRTEKADSFGRWLATVQYRPATGNEDWKNLTTELIKAGHGVARVK